MLRCAIVVCLFPLLGAVPLCAADLHVAPSGSDANPGTSDRPFATLARAQEAVRTVAGREPVTVWIQGGTYYLDETWVLTPRDSGSEAAPVEYRARPGEEVIVSGGRRLELEWKPYRDGIFQATTPPGLEIDQLFVDGERRPMARYPNFDPSQRIYNGFAADAFSPERAARWANPAGGTIHAMHRAHWGGYHYRITGKKADGTIAYEGGWQNNRQMGMHPEHRFVENIFEELDAPGEWFHDAGSSTLYFYPPAGVDLNAAVVEVVRLRHLVELRGTARSPVRNVTLRGITFRHAARTFMDTREPLLRSDWTIYRGGAVLFDGAEDCAVEDSTFDQVGGNTIFVNQYNRRITLRGCLIRESGGNGVAFVGDPAAVRNPLLEYGERQGYADIDTTPGPKGDNYPADCLVQDCLITRIGRVEKQAAGVQISMSRRITVRHCSIYEMPRAGINISEGTWGGHVIEGCDVFDTVLETGDHGSFNSWGRDRFWGLKDAPPDELPELALLDAVEPTVIRNNRWRCDHGWDVDLDDGSSHYTIYNNLLLHGGLKLREGFHREVHNNITVHNSLHPHVWYPNSGDVVTGNIFMGAYRPAAMSRDLAKWGREVDRNLFTTSEADRRKFLEKGCDASSIVGDPLFVSPETGDYRVREGSPAFRIGFESFPMDEFGVRKPELRRIARTPALPDAPGADTETAATSLAARPHAFLGAAIRELSGEEFSAFGVSKESGGVHVAQVPATSAAARAGLRAGDLIQAVGDREVHRIADLIRLRDESAGAPLRLGVIRGQKRETIVVDRYAFVVAEASGDGPFQKVTLGRTATTAEIRRVTARPATHNEPLATLHDGRLAQGYGPVFGNDVTTGRYKVDLGEAREIGELRSWSYNQNGNRRVQRFTVFGSAAPTDPGWDVEDRSRFTPIAEVDAAGPDGGKFLATSIRGAGDAGLGSYRWLVWAVAPVTDIGENTAFQELQVETRSSARASREAPAPREQPNFVVVLADDLGHGDARRSVEARSRRRQREAQALRPLRRPRRDEGPRGGARRQGRGDGEGRGCVEHGCHAALTTEGRLRPTVPASSRTVSWLSWRTFGSC